ncbi:MAG: DUF4340 domain-containing protein [Lachnospiraceae bacterium]|jgi:hypothetical protein
MKDRKQIKLFMAVGILAVLAAGYAGLKYWNTDTDTEEQETKTVIQEIPEEEIREISFNGKTEETITFVKEEDTWYYTEDREFPVDASAMTTMLAPLTSISSERIIKQPDDLEEYGLRRPSKVITVTKTDDSVVTIHLGNMSDTVGEYYAYLNDDTDKIYLLDSYIYTNFDVNLYDLAKAETVSSITSTAVTNLTVEQEKQTFSVFENEDSYTGWTVRDWNGNEKEAGSSQVITEFTSIISNTLSSYVNYNSQDLSIYGLDHPAAVITIDYNEAAESEEDAEAEETTAVKQFIIYVGNTDENGDYYVTTNETSGIYTMDAATISNYLNIDAEKFLCLNPHDYSFADLDKMEVVYEGTLYTIESVTTEKEEDTEQNTSDTEEDSSVTTKMDYYINNEKVDGTAFLAFYNKVSSTAAQKRADDIEFAGGEPEFSYHFYISGGEMLSADYYSYDNNFYLVKDSKENKYLVNKMYVKSMMEAFETLLSTEE